MLFIFGKPRGKEQKFVIFRRAMKVPHFSYYFNWFLQVQLLIAFKELSVRLICSGTVKDV